MGPGTWKLPITFPDPRGRMNQERMNHINAQWDATFPEKEDPVRFWGPNVKLNTKWAVVPGGTPPREDLPIVDPVLAARVTPRVQFDRDQMWVSYWDNRFE